MRILLDKGFIRRALEGFLRIASREALTEEQHAVLSLLRTWHGTQQLYMSYKSFHTLTHRFVHLEIVQRLVFLHSTALSNTLCPALGTTIERFWLRQGRCSHD
ncbi:MAG: hypothetical protein ACREOO_32690 [bacterium]